MPSRRGIFVWVAIGAAVLVLVIAHFAGMSDIASESVRYQLQAFGGSIYEFHERTGRWPTQPDDLASTSLPARSSSWRAVLDNRSVVIVWPQNLNPAPQANANVILAYHNRGLLADFGRKWVCWGDLRTEYVRDAAVRAATAAH